MREDHDNISLIWSIALPAVVKQNAIVFHHFEIIGQMDVQEIAGIDIPEQISLLPKIYFGFLLFYSSPANHHIHCLVISHFFNDF